MTEAPRVETVFQLRTLFDSADRFVVIYSTDHDGRTMRHVRHRQVSKDVHERFPEFSRMDGLSEGPDAARFLMYERHRLTRAE